MTSIPGRRHPATQLPRGHRAGDTAVGTDDVVVERWEKEPLLERIETHLRGPVNGRPAVAIGSVNLDHFHHFRRGRHELSNDPDRTGVDWVMLADGAPVAYQAGRVSGRHWPRLTGADLLPELLATAQRTGSTVGFLGGLPQVHESLRGVLARDYPSVRAGYWAPERHEIDSPTGSTEIAAQIRAEGFDVLAVALGKPRQELWIQRYGRLTGAKVLLAFGASADFLAGKVERAPDWMQNNGLEWAYRLRQEPRRLARRYLVEGPPAIARLASAREVDPPR